MKNTIFKVKKGTEEIDKNRKIEKRKNGRSRKKLNK